MTTLRHRPPAAVTDTLEAAATAIGRLDASLRRHPLAPAWAWRSRLEAVRRQAAVDGQLIDPWHLAAALEGVRFRIDGTSLAERGAVFAAARHALDLWRWYVDPDAERAADIARAAAALAEGGGSALLAAAAVVRDARDHDRPRPPLRAALAGWWPRRGLLPMPAALLTGAGALHGDAPADPDTWTARFLAAVAGEAGFGLSLLRLMERRWFDARHAVAGRRRDSHAAAAIDVLAAAPLLSATALARGLDLAVKTAAALLVDLEQRGLVVEVSRRRKRRLYGLADLAPFRAETRAPPRPRPGRGRGRPRRDAPAVDDGIGDAPAPWTPLPLPATEPLPPVERRAFDVTDLDRWMREADLAIRRTAAVLDGHAAARASPPAPAPDDPDPSDG